MEYVVVVFPTDRFVYIDGEKNGRTNKSLRIDAGSHSFDLGPLKNYEPESQTIEVVDTTVLEPLEIVFAKQEP